MTLFIILSGIIIYSICWALHAFSNYLDFEAPSKEEKKYKKIIKSRYNIKEAEPNKLINIKTKNQEELNRRAKNHADYMMALLNDSTLSSIDAQETYKYFYDQYIEKHKLYFS